MPRRLVWRCLAFLLSGICFVWLGAQTPVPQEPAPATQEAAPPAKEPQEKKNEKAAKGKTKARDYVLVVLLVNAADGSAVREANVRVSYGGEVQAKPCQEGRVTFRFQTEAPEVVIRINAPGMVLYNKPVRLDQANLEHQAGLIRSE